MLFGLAFAFAAGQPDRAAACSYQPLHWSLASEPERVLVFEGWIVSAEKALEQPEPQFEYFDVTVSVTRVHFGKASSDDLRLKVAVRGEAPPVPQPCIPNAFPRDQAFVGKYLLTTLWGGSDMVGPLFTFLGEQPSGPDYEGLTRLIRVASMTDPGLPRLRAFADSPTCPTRVTLIGERFSPGTRYPLQYPNSWDAEGNLTTVLAGADGRFVHRFEISEGNCGAFAEAREPADNGGGGLPLAMARLPGTVGGPPLPPDAGNSGPGKSGPGLVDGLALALLLTGLAGLTAAGWPGPVRRC